MHLLPILAVKFIETLGYSIVLPVLVYLAAGFFALGNGIMWPSFLSILGGLGKPRQQGAIQGIASSAGSLNLLRPLRIYHPVPGWI